jgi:hypothetical protein
MLKYSRMVNSSEYIKSRQCCLSIKIGPTGPRGIQGITGPTGPTGPSGLDIEGNVYSDYLYWNTNMNAWNVGSQNIHIGANAGAINQSIKTVALGYSAGNENQGSYSIAIGNQAGSFNQPSRTIVLNADNIPLNPSISNGLYIKPIRNGNALNALFYDVETNEVVYTLSGTLPIPSSFYGEYLYWDDLCGNSGKWVIGSQNINIGGHAGEYSQRLNAVALGYYAGHENQGNNSIAIGNCAGKINQDCNTIILNATGNELNTVTNNSFYVAPIRKVDVDYHRNYCSNDTHSSHNSNQKYNLLNYNTDTKEITYTDTKTFVIEHPINTNKYLVHGCLEGPEGGVYYRGKGEIVNNVSVDIALPSYVKSLAREFTVQITPIYSGQKIEQLYTSDVENNQFTVYGNNTKFFWLVHGKRCDILVEPDKELTQVNGDGPYKWI